MRKRRAVWGIWLVLALLLYLFENNTGTRTLLLAGVLVPAFSVLCAKGAAGKIRCRLEAPAECAKGEEATCFLQAEGSPLLLFCALHAWVSSENLLSGQGRVRAVTAGGILHPKAACSFTENSCGTVCLSAQKTEVRDVFGLFAFAVEPPQPCYISIPAVLFAVDFRVDESLTSSEDSERWSFLKAGNDPSETFAIREYVPGDPIRQIHWKLSQKTDQLMVRELGLPVSDDVLLLFESALSCDALPEDTPAAAEAMLSLSSALLESAVPHAVAWRNPQLQAIEFFEINNLEDYRLMAGRLLALDCKEGDETIGRAFQQDSGKLYAHTVLFSARPDTDVLPLLGAGRVNLLLPKTQAASAVYGNIHTAAFPYAEEQETLYLEI